MFTDDKMGPDDHLLIGMSHSSLRAEDELPSLSTIDSDSSSWERRPLCNPCYAALTLASQKTLRVLFVGMLLAAVHVIGILISGIKGNVSKDTDTMHSKIPSPIFSMLVGAAPS